MSDYGALAAGRRRYAFEEREGLGVERNVARAPGLRPAHVDRRGVEVEIAGFEPTQFGVSHSGRECGANQIAEAGAAGVQ
jgi:hypothetical protein